ncbi:acetyl-CoA synthetase-like protein [Gonapodya prolifera JEL478]|uniref:Acetyl-CoA synthetase-like protein n=1 Tax=Gonapodya prolifera (strain JEL478) TaxID=1344416 RepID=A0A138ZYG6_GONPJ|nr:acetyl-CoA synthetase-like protein [Gonapodya prolifera JEL478]|eukprot:KXS09539.1 acetyl-CoA synthetase-like protein [Gonapodya prolifera JEL478]
MASNHSFETTVKLPKSLNDALPDSTRTAVIIPNRVKSGKASPYRVSYRELRLVIGLFTSLPPFNKLNKGDKVAFPIPNSLEYLAVFFAVTGRGAVAAPLNPNYTEDELDFFFNDLEARVVIVPRGEAKASRNVAKKLGIPVWEVWVDTLETARGLIPTVQIAYAPHASDTPSSGTAVAPPEWSAFTTPLANSDIGGANIGHASPDAVRVKGVGAGAQEEVDLLGETALFLHTSGTTGRPKGVPLTHRNILTSLHNIRATYQLAPEDTTLVVMPLFHVHGLIGAFLSTLTSGGTAVVPPRFSVGDFWKDFVDFDCSWYSAVPTIHQMLLNRRADTYPGHSGRLRFIRSCSSSLAPQVLKDLESVFKGPVLEAYAMTEAAHQVCSNFLPPAQRFAGSVGKGRGVDAVVMDDAGKYKAADETGEVCVRGVNVMGGYWKNPTANASSFFPDPNDANALPFFRTGDLGYLDHNGFLFLVGRIKEQINRGGEKISPLEVSNSWGACVLQIIIPLVPTTPPPKIDAAFLTIAGVAEACTFPVASQLYGQEIEICVIVKPEAKDTLTDKVLCEEATKILAKFKVPKKIWIVSEIPKGPTGKLNRNYLTKFFGEQKA